MNASQRRFMRRWITALRSGEYQQAIGVLREIDEDGVTRHCCLGVACDLARIKHSDNAPLPPMVAFLRTTGLRASPVDDVDFLSAMNDGSLTGTQEDGSKTIFDSHTFLEIADTLELILVSETA